MISYNYRSVWTCIHFTTSWLGRVVSVALNKTSDCCTNVTHCWVWSLVCLSLPEGGNSLVIVWPVTQASPGGNSLVIVWPVTQASPGGNSQVIVLPVIKVSLILLSCPRLFFSERFTRLLSAAGIGGPSTDVHCSHLFLYSVPGGPLNITRSSFFLLVVSSMKQSIKLLTWCKKNSIFWHLISFYLLRLFFLLRTLPAHWSRITQ